MAELGDCAISRQRHRPIMHDPLEKPAFNGVVIQVPRCKWSETGEWNALERSQFSVSALPE